jgi:RND family efflux transporter MFP subunit
MLFLLLPALPVSVAHAQGGPPPTVTVSPPLKKEIVEWQQFTGQFSAVEYVEIRARVSGYLTEIGFQDGQIVKKGDLLFVIDPRPFQADLALAEANLARDQAQAVRAGLDLKRYAELAKNSFASQQQYESSRAAADAAAASVRGDQAAVDQAKLNLEFTRITAPLTGRIGSHQVSIGNLVNGGSTGGTTLLTTIVSVDPIYLNFDMSETDFLGLERTARTGQFAFSRETDVTVHAKLVDEKNWLHQGKLNFIDNQLDRGSGTIRARAVFPNVDGTITPGQFARVRVPASPLYEAILIPDEAIVADQSRRIVMTVKPDGTVEPRVIRPGPGYQGLRIVRNGLSADDVIVIDGLMRIRPGAKVNPQPGKIATDPERD